MNSTPHSTVATDVGEPRARLRTSELLRAILTNNPDAKTFSVERILASIGNERFEASLTMFALPALVPVPYPGGMVAMPTGVIAGQLMAGQKQIKLPSFILKKTVTRKSLAIAIHAIAPILEAAEKVVKPRWSWASSPLARRAIGLLIFLLAVAIAYPLAGFTGLHSASIIAVALGLAEQDGLAIVIGLVAGVLSLAIVAAAGLSVRALSPKVRKFLRSIARKLGLKTIARVIERSGYPQLARLVTIRWSELLLLWDPEQHAAHRRAARMPPSTLAIVGEQQTVALGFAGSDQAVQIACVPRVDQTRAQVGEQTRL